MVKKYSKTRSRRRRRSVNRKSQLAISMKSKPGFVRRHRKKLIAGLGIGGAILMAYKQGYGYADLATLFNKSRRYVEGAVANGKSKLNDVLHPKKKWWERGVYWDY